MFVAEATNETFAWDEVASEIAEYSKKFSLPCLCMGEKNLSVLICITCSSYYFETIHF